MKLIDKAEKIWTQTKKTIIEQYCPCDMGNEYNQYVRECGSIRCKECWEQTIEEGLAKRDYEKCIQFIMQSYKNLETELKAYKDLGITPEQIKQMDVFYTEKCQELARLEEHVKEGRPESKFIICQKRDCPNWQQDSCNKTFVSLGQDGKCLGAEQSKEATCEEKKGSSSEEN